MLEQKVKEANPGDRGFIYMVAYELFSDDGKNGYEFIGMLPERRKDPKRITKESVLKWGRMLLHDSTDDKNIFFKQVEIDHSTGHVFEDNTVFNNY